MAQIIRACSNDGDIPAGFPILLDNQYTIIEPAFRYLAHLAFVKGRSRATETIRTYAEHLYDWFDTLEQSGLDWRIVDVDTIAGYRNRMLEGPSPHTGRSYARSTINDRIRTICRFYDWAVSIGLIDERPFYFEEARTQHASRKGFLAHLSAGRSNDRVNILTVPEYERLPRPLRPWEIEAVFAHLAAPYRLIGQWALVTGMRRCELCALQIDQIPDSAKIDAASDPLMGVALTLTKGARPRTVYVPFRLIDQTHWYIGEERVAILKSRRRRGRPAQPTGSLFLNSRGAPVTKARLTAVFRQAFEAAGVRGTLHWLRHTFAMTLLARLQARLPNTPDLNPLKIVQVLLGHSSIETTSIYLRCVEMHDAAIAESIAYLYGEVIDNG